MLSTRPWIKRHNTEQQPTVRLRRGPTGSLCVGFVCALSALPLLSCSKDVEPGWHIGIYMAADNNLDGAASSDLIELANAKSNGAVRVTVFLDRAAPGTYSPADVPGLEPSGAARIVELVGKKYEVVEELGEVDSLATDQLRGFLQRIDSSPEEHKAVILWDHGSPDSFGSDETDASHSMNLSALTEAFQVDPEDPEAGSYHFDVVGFDTCLMGSMAALETFSKLTDVYVGSAELEPGSGWNYDGIMRGITDPDMSAQDFGKLVVTSYEDFYTENPERANGLAVTLSAWDTDLTLINEKLTSLVTKVAALPAEESSEIYASLTQAVSGAHAYNSDPSRPPRSVDLGDILEELSADDLGEVSVAADELGQALRDNRLAWGSAESVSAALGLSASSTAKNLEGFFVDTLGEESAGYLQLAAQDMLPPEVSLTWVDRSENQGISFGLVEFSASDDALLTQARLSLGRSEVDGSLTLLASFRIDAASGLAALAPSEYGVPLGTMTFDADGDSVATEDLGLLLLDQGQFRLAVRVQGAMAEYSGLIQLDEAFAPVSIVLENPADQTSAVFSWAEVLTHADITIAPELGVVLAGTEEIVRTPGRFRPPSEISIDFADLAAEMGLSIIGSAVDLDSSATRLQVPVP